MAAQWPLLAVLGVLTAGIAVMASSGPRPLYRSGGTLVAGALALAAALRAVLPTRLAGLLVARSRGFDVVLLLLAAGVVAVLALTIPFEAPPS